MYKKVIHYKEREREDLKIKKNDRDLNVNDP